MAYIANLYVEAGATFSRVVTYTQEDGSLADLTGFTAELQVRETVESSTVKIQKTPQIDVEAATISWTFTAAETATLTAPSYVYALELTAPDDTVTRLLEGHLTVSPEVVR